MRASKFIGTEPRVETHKLSEIWAEGEKLTLLNRWGIAAHLLDVALKGIRLSLLTSFLTLITITCSLTLFGAFILLVQNMNSFVSSTREELTVSIYLREGTDKIKVEELERELRALPEVEKVEYRSKEEALKSFSDSLGSDTSLVEGLREQNPLPSSLEVRFRKANATEEAFRRLENEYAGHSVVDTIQYGKGALSQLGIVAGVLRTGGFIGIISMLAVTAFLIFNAIKLAVFSHREEIEIMELVGANDWYIQTPFLIEGTLQGLIGSVLSLVLLGISFSALSNAFERSGILEITGGALHFLHPLSIVFILVAGIVIGLFSSAVSVRRFGGAAS